jgi:hypothetical protein
MGCLTRSSLVPEVQKRMEPFCPASLASYTISQLPFRGIHISYGYEPCRFCSQGQAKELVKNLRLALCIFPYEPRFLELAFSPRSPACMFPCESSFLEPSDVLQIHRLSRYFLSDLIGNRDSEIIIFLCLLTISVRAVRADAHRNFDYICFE